jgi:8-oxo-dGTP pyrophosphatase MutT (NUDIX family)
MKEGVPAWSVVVVVSNGNNDVLAISRGFNLQDPALPGGDSEPFDESPVQTAARELYEETGLRAQGEANCIDSWTGERGQPVFAFYVSQWRGRLRTSSEGKPFWTQPKNLLARGAYYRDEAKRVFEKLQELKLQLQRTA